MPNNTIHDLTRKRIIGVLKIAEALIKSCEIVAPDEHIHRLASAQSDIRNVWEKLEGEINAQV